MQSETLSCAMKDPRLMSRTCLRQSRSFPLGEWETNNSVGKTTHTRWCFQLDWLGIMTVHKLCNGKETAVIDMLQGVTALNTNASMLDGVDQGIKVVYNSAHKATDVAVISGGGSGHEPATAGYVGPGMLAAAVCGDVFASPTSRAVYEAILKVTGEAGCLVIVLNYTGDRLHFGMAVEMARADGLDVELMFVADDCGVAVPGIAGARGIAGTAMIQKVAGAAAAAGQSLEEVSKVARNAAAGLKSMGAALTTCSLPGATQAAEGPQEGEMELGLGIHGEPGAQRCAVMSSQATVEHLLKAVLGAFKGGAGSNGSLEAGERVALLVNNLGGTTTLELFTVARDALAYLTGKGIKVERAAVGTFISSLDMAGVSLSVMRLTDDLVKLLDAPTAAPAWPHTMAAPELGKPLQPLSERSRMAAEHDKATAASEEGGGNLSEAAERVRGVLRGCAEACIAAEADLTKQDEKAGDGDCGETVKRGSEAVLRALGVLSYSDLGAAAKRLALTVGESMGGTSGALYQIFFAAAATTLNGVAAEAAGPEDWGSALQAGVEAVRRYGLAAVGDRTMVDALEPAMHAINAAVEAGGSVAAAVAEAGSQAAQQGADATRDMPGRGGRAGCVNPELLKGVADPGASAVAAWMAAIAKGMQ
eukprot:jgi/Ulvmu1/5289/UM022_0083.1